MTRTDNIAEQNVTLGPSQLVKWPLLVSLTPLDSFFSVPSWHSRCSPDRYGSRVDSN